MTREKIIVVGAGFSGLAAASSLAQHPDRFEVVVLEARDRIGGRVWTVSIGGQTVDLGASWIHGLDKNPLVELAERYRVRHVPTDNSAVSAFDSDGRRLTPGELAQWEALEGAMEDASAREGVAVDDVSLADGSDFFAEALARQGLEGRIAEQVLSGMEGWMGGSIQEMAVSNLHDPDMPAPPDNDLMDEGYGQIAAGLAQGLDIRLEHVVTRIACDERGVRVETSRGVFEGARAVITLPLGVLKADVVTFDPPLPEAKQEAIRRIGMGLLDKLVLRFDRPFWEPNVGWVLVLPGGDARLPHDYLSLCPFMNAPILVGFVAAERARAYERYSDQELVANAMASLRRAYGDAVPDPTEVRITRWWNDPFARGSYSFPKVGMRRSHFGELAAPVSDRLFFAGEAATSVDWSLLHGAYKSGLRAAEEIMAVALKG